MVAMVVEGEVVFAGVEDALVPTREEPNVFLAIGSGPTVGVGSREALEALQEERARAAGSTHMKRSLAQSRQLRAGSGQTMARIVQSAPSWVQSLK